MATKGTERGVAKLTPPIEKLILKNLWKKKWRQKPQTERNYKERFRVGQSVVSPSELELPSVVEEVSYSINQS